MSMQGKGYPEQSVRTEEKQMNKVQRTRGIRKMVRRVVCREQVQKYVTAGDRACGRMMHEFRPQLRKQGPSDSAILAWAMSDLSRELMVGFWNNRAA